MMDFRIADTFTDSLSKLTGDEQKQIKTTAFDLQLNPANPGMSFHKLDKAKDTNFWSIRVSRDIRLIVHKTNSSLLLCYVDHHDKAYHWAERRKLETHPKTGAAQLVVVRETIQEIVVPAYITAEPIQAVKLALFQHVTDEELLAYGVPVDWLTDVRKTDEDSLLQIAEHLPSEAAEALLELATGGQPPIPIVVPVGTNPFDHPDAQRRFRVMTDIDELERALDFPWEKWAVFLHPAQRQIVEKDFNGPARVSGSAGTGKTIVALHRAVYLARSQPDSRILLTTFSDTLANALRIKLRRLISNEPRIAERLEVVAIDEVGVRLYESEFGKVKLASSDEINDLINEGRKLVEAVKFSSRFLLSEWVDVVDAWQLQSWDDYKDVKRLGRKTRLAEPHRKNLWAVFEYVKENLAKQGKITTSEMFSLIAEKLSNRVSPPYDYSIVDEAQDIGVAQLRFLAALGKDRPNSLFFAGDLGQRIFQTPFSWLSLGVDIRGRSQTLRINYRTSHQIRSQADLLLAPQVVDVDGNVEERKGTISVFNGSPPEINTFAKVDEEIKAVADWLNVINADGIVPNELGVFVRSKGQLDRARAALQLSGLPFSILDEHIELITGKVTISTMHLAKGLEFRAVVVMACDDEVIPLQDRIESVTDDSDLKEVYETERHLLYVACTRARDDLLVTGLNPASEFLDDLAG
jgi:mRNA-degrading endonuclease RelE of RelBE toxin-antitoxin system